jgi:CRISPR-associated endoribonuclease Cas6
MIFTSENEASIAGISVVLQSSNRMDFTPLNSWFSDLAPLPLWIPLARKNGVNKVLAVSSHPEQYPEMLQYIFGQISRRMAVEWQGQVYELSGVEVDSHELHVLEIALFASNPLPSSLGRAIHAQCFDWIGNADPALAEQLHQADFFPLTLVVKPGASANQMFLRIGVLQQKILAPLLWGMSRDMGGEISLTGVPCRLGKWIDIKHATSFAALTQVAAQNVINLEFLSPTSFKQAQAIQPFPLPELVFSSLLRRWNAIAPPQFLFEPLEWQAFVSAYELKTVALKMKGGSEIGAKGWVKYEFPNREQAQIATILAHFAGIAGVGRKTGMGMGQTRLLSV